MKWKKIKMNIYRDRGMYTLEGVWKWKREGAFNISGKRYSRPQWVQKETDRPSSSSSLLISTKFSFSFVNRNNSIQQKTFRIESSEFRSLSPKSKSMVSYSTFILLLSLFSLNLNFLVISFCDITFVNSIWICMLL